MLAPTNNLASSWDEWSWQPNPISTAGATGKGIRAVFTEVVPAGHSVNPIAAIGCTLAAPWTHVVKMLLIIPNIFAY